MPLVLLCWQCRISFVGHAEYECAVGGSSIFSLVDSPYSGHLCETHAVKRKKQPERTNHSEAKFNSKNVNAKNNCAGTSSCISVTLRTVKFLRRIALKRRRFLRAHSSQSKRPLMRAQTFKILVHGHIKWPYRPSQCTWLKYAWPEFFVRLTSSSICSLSSALQQAASAKRVKK